MRSSILYLWIAWLYLPLLGMWGWAYGQIWSAALFLLSFPSWQGYIKEPHNISITLGVHFKSRLFGKKGLRCLLNNKNNNALSLKEPSLCHLERSEGSWNDIHEKILRRCASQNDSRRGGIMYCCCKQMDDYKIKSTISPAASAKRMTYAI